MARKAKGGSAKSRKGKGEGSADPKKRTGAGDSAGPKGRQPDKRGGSGAGRQEGGSGAGRER